MKIAFVITCLGIGGAEKVVVNLANGLANRGHEVIIIYLKGNAILRPKNSSIPLFGLDLATTRDLFRAAFTLRKLLVEFRPDVVHSHLVHANILVRLLRLVIHIPRLITTAHNTNEGGRLRMLAYRITDRLADLSTNVSDEAVSSFIKRGAVKYGRMITVHNGISTSEFCYTSVAEDRIRDEFGVAPSTRLITAVGRLSVQKDYPNLLRALSKLKVEPQSFLLLIAGDGLLWRDLHAMVSQLDLTDRVRFLGVRRDVPDLLSASDIFVLASAWEGFPLVVGEAMACECVVVATDCGGVKEFVGEHGLLVPPRNADELANQLTNALALNLEERLIYGKAARSRVKQLYSLEASIDKWVRIYLDQSEQPT